MLRTIEINSGNIDDDELRRLYESALPADEKIPYDKLIHLLNYLDTDFKAYYEGEILVGMTIVYRLPNYNFGVYFAVREDLRGKGYGQKILSALLEKYRSGHPFILITESPMQKDAPNPELRKRRHNFYLRNGFRDTGVYYTDESGTFNVMSNSQRPFTQQDFEKMSGEFQPAFEKCTENK